MNTNLNNYKNTKPLLVCIDSDGCAMNTMNIKHFEAFGPMLVQEWGLESIEEEVLTRWNQFNLFELTRGINRFKGLEKMLTELVNKGVDIKGYKDIKAWTDTTDSFSNPSLEKAILEQPNAIGLQKALNWSNLVNEKIKTLPATGPFDNVTDTLAYISKFADIAVVSSANLSAVQHEFNTFGLAPYINGLFAQEAGTKEHCLASLTKYYKSNEIIMLGDALGDYKAAQQNNIFFYPILANHESTSWQTFKDTYFEKFKNNQLSADDQSQLLNQFKNNLNGGEK